MSRTYRKRFKKFENYYHNHIDYVTNEEWSYKYWVVRKGFANIDQYVAKLKAQYYSKTDYWLSGNPPKEHRKNINRKRRRTDKQELWKAINLVDHEEQCSQWNCKDADHWGWF